MKRHLAKCSNYQKRLSLRKKDSSTLRYSIVMAIEASDSCTPTTDLSGLMEAQSLSSISALVCSSCQHVPGRRGSLANHFGDVLPAWQVAEMHVILVEMIVDSALPFSVVSCNSFRRFVDKLHPQTSLLLPAHTKVKDLLFDSAAAAQENVNSVIEIELKRDTEEAWLLTRGQTQIKFKWISLGPTSFMLRSILCGVDHHGIAVARGWEILLVETYHQYNFSLLLL